MRLRLSGGEWLQVEKVRLYKAAAVSEIMAARSKAAKLLAPSGSTVGVFGSPSWELAAEATVISMVSGLLANSSIKQAAQEIQKAQRAHEFLLQRMGVEFALADIRNIGLPNPATWSASHKGEAYAHSGDDFVWIMTDAEQMIAVRWGALSAVEPPPLAIQELSTPAPPPVVKPVHGRHAVGKVKDSGSMSGMMYTIYDDGKVIAEINAVPFTWNSLEELQIWADARSARK